jgi:alpha-N-arabinofuranosidase
MRFKPERDGDEAGMTVFISYKGHYAFSLTRHSGENRVEVRKNGEETPRYSAPFAGSDIHFRIEAGKARYRLRYSADGWDWLEACDVPVLAYADAGDGYTGTLIGVFAQREAETGARAEITEFTIYPWGSSKKAPLLQRG